MSGAIISYRNDADAAMLSGGEKAGCPLVNLQSRQLSTLWRCASATSPAIVVDLGAAKVVRVIALANTNANFAVANRTSVEYSVNGSAWTDAGVVWGREGGGASARAAKDLAGIMIALLPGLARRYWRITPNWTRADGSSDYAAGRLWVGDAIVVPEGVESGWTRGFTDAGRLDFAAGLEAYEDPRPRGRVIGFSFSGLEPEIAYGFSEHALNAGDTPSFDGMQMEAGITGEVIALPVTRTPLWIRRTGIYGHIQSPWEIRNQSGPNYAADFRVVEER